jgi:hypothetical protein
MENVSQNKKMNGAESGSTVHFLESGPIGRQIERKTVNITI